MFKRKLFDIVLMKTIIERKLLCCSDEKQNKTKLS